jgi:hypothetical protein
LTPARSSLPTLTEVIEVASHDERADIAPLPLPPESVPMELRDAGLPPAAPPVLSPPSEAWIGAVLQRLQPRVDAWVEARAQQLVGEASRTLARELSTELPALARTAIDEVARDAKG